MKNQFIGIYTMVLITLLVGALLVAAIMTFIGLGVTNPVPWLFLLAIVVVVIYTRRRDKDQFVQWKDEYSVGIEAIDNDHRRLLNLINQFQTAVFYQTGSQFEDEAFDALIDYTRTHFAREEQLMAEYAYPDLEAHKAEHEKMIALVETRMAEHRTPGHHETLVEMVNFLRDWLINHINGTDQAYSGFLHDKGVH